MRPTVSRLHPHEYAHSMNAVAWTHLPLCKIRSVDESVPYTSHHEHKHKFPPPGNY